MPHTNVKSLTNSRYRNSKGHGLPEWDLGWYTWKTSKLILAFQKTVELDFSSFSE